MLDFDKTRDIILSELRAKGYNPNPGDILGAVNKLVALSKEGDAVAPDASPAPVVPAVVPPAKKLGG